MNSSDTGQVSASAAEVYEEFFLPALFQRWAEPLVTAAQVAPGDRVLDVACGTGIAARSAAGRVGSQGAVVGVDINPGMLRVARIKAPEMQWLEASAEELPFEDESFDAVLCQFALMFFTDKVAALEEMARVLKPGGRLAVAVWDALENTPGYAAMTDLLRRLFGDEAARSLESPYSLGDTDRLRDLFANAGLGDVRLETRNDTANFASIEAWVRTDVKGWTLADTLDDEQYQRLLHEAERELRRFAMATGEVAFPASAHFVLWDKEP
ncbi:MAG TPA: methyltransferase domain-containing protein [Trueperaceae bacterium]|nr:methyltransferase domain-containing protein [Trueperaceae bacterium]